MRILYIFPHPDDESFGPAALIHLQKKRGDEVFLLTLTRGGATKQRFRLGLSVEQMGVVRLREMQKVEKVLELDGMKVLDLPDSGLKELDPRVIERVVRDEIVRLRPDVVVSYPVSGVSGFQDHLVTHAVVKRVFVEVREEIPELRRFAMFTVSEGNPAAHDSGFKLHPSRKEEIDCVVPLTSDAKEAMRRALDCYETYQQTIRESNVMETVGDSVSLEFFQERFDPPLSDPTAHLTDS